MTVNTNPNFNIPVIRLRLRTHGFPLYTGKEFLGNLLYDRLETDG